MNNILRANLKKLCPYSGPHIPNSVREKAIQCWPARNVDEVAGWQWDDEGPRRWELDLCDLDADHVDPDGYAAIRPLGQGKCTLEILATGVEDFSPLIFQTVQEAKRYLDTLLAAETPKIPLEG
jgi:hypothetical protein